MNEQIVQNKNEILNNKFEFPSGSFEYLGGSVEKQNKGTFKIGDSIVPLSDSFSNYELVGVNVVSNENPFDEPNKNSASRREIREKVIDKMIKEATDNDLENIVKTLEGFK